VGRSSSESNPLPPDQPGKKEACERGTKVGGNARVGDSDAGGDRALMQVVMRAIMGAMKGTAMRAITKEATEAIMGEMGKMVPALAALAIETNTMAVTGEITAAATSIFRCHHGVKSHLRNRIHIKVLHLWTASHAYERVLTD